MFVCLFVLCMFNICLEELQSFFQLSNSFPPLLFGPLSNQDFNVKTFCIKVYANTSLFLVDGLFIASNVV